MEKYYDCLQCGEQCRHVVNNNCRVTEINTKYLINNNNISLPIAAPLRVTESRNEDPRLTSIRKLPQTPAKKRSSLARPVRVHDAFTQPKIISNYTTQQPNDNAYKTFECTETAWPMRIRLEEMLEMTLPQGKRNKRGFKDTEKLLNVLSINNVDQDRYNVKRCSLM